MKNSVVICGINTSTLPKISESESNRLLNEIANGNTHAREQFIVANMRLVLSVIKRFRSKKGFNQETKQILIGEGIKKFVVKQVI